MRKVWDARSMEERFSLPTLTDRIVCCAFTPDDRFIVSASLNATVKLWDRATGEEVAALSLPGNIMHIALHPFRPQFLVGDAGGSVHILDLISIAYGPLIVSPMHDEAGSLWVRCPCCGKHVEIEKDSLGAVLSCPHPDCACVMRINTFVTGAPGSGLPDEPEWATPDPLELDPGPAVIDDPWPDDLVAATTPQQRHIRAQVVFGGQREDPTKSPTLGERFTEIASFRALLRGSLSAELWETFRITCHWGPWASPSEEEERNTEGIFGAFARLRVDEEVWQLGIAPISTSPTGIVWLFIPTTDRRIDYGGHKGWPEDMPNSEEPTLERFLLEQIRLFRLARSAVLSDDPPKRIHWRIWRRRH